MNQADTRRRFVVPQRQAEGRDDDPQRKPSAGAATPVTAGATATV